MCSLSKSAKIFFLEKVDVDTNMILNGYLPFENWQRCSSWGFKVLQFLPHLRHTQTRRKTCLGRLQESTGPKRIVSQPLFHSSNVAASSRSRFDQEQKLPQKKKHGLLGCQSSGLPHDS